MFSGKGREFSGCNKTLSRRQYSNFTQTVGNYLFEYIRIRAKIVGPAKGAHTFRLRPCRCGERRAAPSAMFGSRNPAVPTPRRRRASACRRGFRRTPVQPESSVAVAPASPRRGRDLASGFRAHSALSRRPPFLGFGGSARRSLRDAVPPRRRPGRAPMRGQAAHRASARTPFGLTPPAVPFPESSSSIAAFPRPGAPPRQTAERKGPIDGHTPLTLREDGETETGGDAGADGQGRSGQRAANGEVGAGAVRHGRRPARAERSGPRRNAPRPAPQSPPSLAA